MRSSEKITFLGVILALLCASAAAHHLHIHHHFANPRVDYGIAHLATALFSSALFTAAACLLRAYFSKPNRLQNRSTVFYLGVITLAFACFWLPVLLASGFANDDWFLLLAASTRKIIYFHPLYSWHALDTVDGNFRPLGTVLYVGYLYHFFGLHPLPYLTGNFLLSLFTTFLAFFIVRELGYSRLAAAAAAILFLSRDILYAPIAWVAAIGDAIVLLLGALIVLCILRARKRRPVLHHTLAWALFLLATLAKQSSFAIPLIVALLLFIHPGQGALPSLTRRIRAAALALAVYGSTAAFIFLHAKSLFGARVPYPLSVTPNSIFSLFNYAIWYFFPLDLPSNSHWVNLLPQLAGIAVVLALALLLRRYPRLLGHSPRDVWFLLLAAAASLSLFIALPTRGAGYYGCMAAFWISLAFGILFTRTHTGVRAPRVASILVCVLVVAGFLDVRLKQTALIPSGGYIWGTASSDMQAADNTRIRSLLAQSPDRDTLVLVGFPANTVHLPMALLASPRLQRVVVRNAEGTSYWSNDLEGLRPRDTYASLNDPQVYHWTIPIPHVEKASDPDRALWLRWNNGTITSMEPLR